MPHTGREGAIRSGMAHTAWHLRFPSKALPPGSRAGVWDRVVRPSHFFTPAKSARNGPLAFCTPSPIDGVHEQKAGLKGPWEHTS